MQKTTYDCLIIGGGISGIAFAHQLCRAGKKIILLEKEEQIGGQIQTRYATGSGLWFEAGAHTLYNSYTSLLSIAQDMDWMDQIQPLNKAPYRTYREDRLQGMFSGISYFSLLLNAPRLLFASKTNQTVREFYAPLVGKKNYENYFTKLFRTILSQDADDYPAELLMKKRASRLKDLPRRCSFRNGLSSFLEAVAAQDGFETKRGNEAIQINPMKIENGQSVYEVTTSCGKTYTAASLALAVDPQTAARLLKSHETILAQLLADIETYHSESLSVVMPKSALQVPEMAGVISLSDTFLSAVSRDLVPHPSQRAFAFHFRNGTHQLHEKLDLITRVLQIAPGDIIETVATTHVLPCLRIRHLGMQQKVEAATKNKNLYLLGNYFEGLSLEDCVRRSLSESERYLHA